MRRFSRAQPPLHWEDPHWIFRGTKYPSAWSNNCVIIHREFSSGKIHFYFFRYCKREPLLILDRFMQSSRRKAKCDFFFEDSFQWKLYLRIRFLLWNYAYCNWLTIWLMIKCNTWGRCWLHGIAISSLWQLWCLLKFNTVDR